MGQARQRDTTCATYDIRRSIDDSSGSLVTELKNEARPGVSIPVVPGIAMGWQGLILCIK